MYTVFALNGKEQLASRFNFTYRYIDDVFSLNSLRITWTRCMLLNLRSKTRQRTTLLLLTWFYSCQSGGMVNFTLPIMTNVTIVTFISQTFRSWEAICQLRLLAAYTIWTGLLIILPCYERFLGIFVGCACRKGMLTPLDIWPRPIWDLCVMYS